MASKTLRDLGGADHVPAALASSTLVLVDYQNTYTRGVMELDGWKPALEAASDLLSRAREAGAAVIHVQHDDGEGSPYDIRTEIGEIHPGVAPVEGEPVVVKQAPDAFHGTDLGRLVDEAGNETVIVAGFMTHMCVAYTTASAALRGNKPTVPADACATRSIVDVSADELHRSALAAIADAYGVVVPSHTALT
ncbi:cysteine hydrolase family protein [Streptomyces coacervatus]|uniref:Cysteine hydrolase family protein n=1 Tax=Streptomyces coacervatus TaxID=647381 RepID=A0ABP7IY40_9ACTN|nr:cysteine hydrolase family protein [Streptomyces coacervatus]MDF2270206.1 cysteine hydrolase family protein [Streptomyces coacervatus]